MTRALVLVAASLLVACAPDDRALSSPTVECGPGDGGILSCSGRGPICCWDPVAMNGRCLRTDQTCATSFELLCDGPEDCLAGQECCLAKDGKGTSCVATSSCLAPIVHAPCSCPFAGACCLVGPADTLVCTLVGCATG